MILGRIEDDYNFEHVIFEAHLASRDMEELSLRLDELGDRLAAARLEHLASRERNDLLADDAVGVRSNP
ncbi:MAG: hypothetical protein ACRDL8_04770, partial [Solirubrobacteraceae bacterium]